MRIRFSKTLRRVGLSLVAGSCGSFVCGGLAASTAHADHPPFCHHAATVPSAAHVGGEPDRWDWLKPDRIGRIFGVGWGNGYHACPECRAHRSAVHIPAPVVSANPWARWLGRPTRAAAGAGVGGAPTTRVKAGRTEIDGVEIDAGAAIAAFHAPAWHGDDTWLTPADSVLNPADSAVPPLTPEAVDAPLPSPELPPAGELPPEAVLDDPCELPAAVEQTYLFDPHAKSKLSDEMIPIHGTLLAPLVRPVPLPSVTGAPRPHRLPIEPTAPRTARAASAANR